MPSRSLSMRYASHSFAACWFLENFHTIQTFGAAALTRLPGSPWGSSPRKVLANTGGLVSSVVRYAEGRALGLEGRRGPRSQFPGVGIFQVVGVEQVLPVEHRRQDVEDRKAVPAALHLDERLRRGNPAAVLLRRRIGDVGKVQQILVVEPGQDRRAVVDDVVAGTGRELGRHARGNVEMGNVVDPYLDAVFLAPFLGELVVPGVVRRDEVAPLQDSQGRSLDLRWGLSGIEHRQQRATRDPGAGGREEFSAVEG